MKLAKASVFAACISLVAAVLYAACGKKNDTGSSTSADGGSVEARFAPSQLQIKDETAAQLLLAGHTQGELSVPGPDALLTTPSNPHAPAEPLSIIGQSSETSLKSISYRLSNIELCGVLNGQGAAGGDTCRERPWSIYNSSAASSSEYDNFGPAEAENFAGFTNFLDPSALLGLGARATYSSTHVGSYEGILVHFFRPFKVNASVKLNNGVTVHTKKKLKYTSNSKSGLDVTYQAEADDLTTGSSEEGVFFLPNGGKSFWMQRPFEITSADVENKTRFKMVIAYDPNNAIKASGIYPDGLPTDWKEGMVDLTKGYQIRAPFLEFAPVLARENETIMRETYWLNSTTGGHDVPHSVRLTLYYVKEDATKAVRAVTSALVYNTLTTRSMSFNPLGQIRLVKENADGTLNFETNGVKILSSFKRQSTTGTVAKVTSELCNGGFNESGCSVALQQRDYDYTLVGEASVDSALVIDYLPTPTPTTAPTP